MDEVRLTREQLYDLVWSRPVRTVANEFGITDVGLKKICRRHSVPTPGLGYWAKLASGRKPHRTKLPTEKPGEPNENEIVLLKRAPIDQSAPKPPAPPPIEARIKVSAQLRDPHSLILKSKLQMEKCKPDHRGMIGPGYGGLNIYVSPELAPRSLRILDAFVKECQARGFNVSATQEYPHETRVLVRGLTFTIEMTEAKTRVKHQLTKDDERRLAQHLHVEQWHDEPNGRLRFKLRHNRWSPQTWEDRKHQRIEDVLDDAFVWLEAEAELQLLRQKQRAEEEKLRWAREEREHKERARVEQLKQEAAQWREANLLREYVNAVRAEMLNRSGRIDPGSPADEWLTWASTVVENLDPLRPQSTEKSNG